MSIHVLAGIVFVGGSAIAASLFPRYAPVAATGGTTTGAETTTAGTTTGAETTTAPPGAAAPAPAASPPDASAGRSRAVAVALHRITRGYSLLGLVVPAAGIVLAFVQGRSGEIWITLAMVLTAAAGVLLALQIYPRQRAALAVPARSGELRTLSMLAGFYNLLWAVVVVLMIVRPGAAYGA
nr:hypothetical protein [Planomonospora venezuelensis]